MLKILYIDDNLSLCKLFQCLGEEYDFQPFVAHSLDQGIVLAEECQPDVILTDINMPDRDGLVLTARLKTNPKTKHIPVVGCSVTYEDRGKKMSLVGGAKFVNDKPATLEKLQMILEGIIPFLNPSSSREDKS